MPEPALHAIAKDALSALNVFHGDLAAQHYCILRYLQQQTEWCAKLCDLRAASLREAVGNEKRMAEYRIAASALELAAIAIRQAADLPRNAVTGASPDALG